MKDNFAHNSLPSLDLQPDYVFTVAEQNLPNIKAANLRLKAAEKNKLVAKAGFFPTLSFGYGLSSNFSNQFKYTSGFDITGVSAITPASPFVTVNNSKYFVQSPTYTATTANRNWGNIWNGWGNQCGISCVLTTQSWAQGPINR